MITRFRLPYILAPLLILSSFTKTNAELTDNAFASLATAFDQEVRPLLDRYCLDCHASDVKKGELDLERFQSLSEVRGDPETWQHLLDQLETNEMPPRDKKQPTREERESLSGWTRRYLDHEARTREGDPGPVVLRRLSHTEFAYTVRDLTGVPTLDPTKEFPVESAAGEGFTNTGDALVMSPALLEKYLQAGKGIAAHAVLLPEGFRFSPHTTRRDWSNAILNEIRTLYHEKLHGAELDFAYKGREVGSVLPTGAADGKLNLEPYFDFLLENRESLMGSVENAAEWAPKNLNSKYATLLAKMLVTNSSNPSPLLDRLRRRWRSLQPQESKVLVDEVQRWQSQLWKFNPVGHLGVEQSWQEPVSPLQNERRFRIKIHPPDPQTDAIIRLEAGTAGDSGESDIVRWKNPRVERAGQPAIPLRDVSAAAAGFSHLRSETIGQLTKLLGLAFAWRSRAPIAESEAVNLAATEGFDAQTLLSLFRFLGMLSSGEVEIQGHLHQRIEQLAGDSSVQGWTLPGVADLTFLANASDRTLRIPGEAPPKKIVVHPRPERWVAAGWKSPVTGRINIAASVADRHPACGNGVRWSLEHQRGNQRQVLQSGANSLGQTVTIEPITDLLIRAGEVISLMIGARDGNHACDLTEIDLNVTMQSDGTSAWSLSADCATSLATSNPHPDRYDHPDVWHFYSGPEESAAETTWQTVPAGSLLSEWTRAEDADAAAKIAARVQSFLSQPPSPTTPDPDVALHAQMTQPFGALFARVDFARLAAHARDNGWAFETEGLRPNRFDENGDLVVRAPSAVSFTLPSAFFTGAEFVVTGTLDERFGESGSVQLDVSTSATDSYPLTALRPELPVTVSPGSTAEQAFQKTFDSFRDLFPAAMCYARIVPIDEVVTLVLYHREDAHLARLMLTEDEQRRLDRLWEELHYVSQDALKIVDALEQIIEFATQDADPRKFYPLREPIAKQAEAFRQQLTDGEPSHLDALVTFAPRVFRRPLTTEETEELRSFYRQLRESALPHDEAFRLTLARLFTSPTFLYRTETPAPGVNAGPVSSWELATRLSYFLWSSAPDEELHRLASTEALLESDTLLEQARRMLQDKRVRRLAIEFACQWLHLRDFDQLDEKSERHFPEFVGLRESMYEESIRFFTDLFQNNGSILAILDADHTYVDPALADFYGLGETVSGGWERVSGLRAKGRGGILGMASTLAKQSGASRTSPVLRGAWVSETLLGEKLPKPPAQVPPLPEAVPAGLTERQLIERHRADPACANCHARIDPYGLALESFDAIGRLRALGGDGQPIDSHAELRDGTQFVGIDGLRDYLLTVRGEAFVRQFCKKLLGYALGRSVLLSDEPLLDEMEENLRQHDYAFATAVETIVLSRQFREIRGAPQR